MTDAFAVGLLAHGSPRFSAVVLEMNRAGIA